MNKHLTKILTAYSFAIALTATQSFAQDANVVKSHGIATTHSEIEFRAIELKDAFNKAPRKPIEFIGNKAAREIPEQAPNPAAVKFQDPFTSQSSANFGFSVGIPSPAPIENFNALNDNGVSIPPDVNGAVGTTHLMTTLNTQVRIQTRAGVNVSTVTLNSFFASVGATGVYDPKILFDHVDKRWMFIASSDAQSNASSTLLAVSKTEDPTGGWNIYRVDVDATNTKWVDYPSIGYNHKWIVVQMNLFPMPNQSASAHQIYVWDKADVYANGTGLFTKFDITNEATAIACPSIHYDSSIMNKMYTVRVVSGNSGARGTIGMRTITGPTNSPVLSTETQIQTTSTWGSSGNNNTDFGPQLGTTNRIATNDHRMRHVVFRNGKLWAVHSVFLPASNPTRSAVQWWQLDTAGAVQQRARIEDPTGKRFYSFPSIAVNSKNDALIGYASFSADQYASGAYSFRASTDPINTFRNEYVYKYGENTYFKNFGGTRNRWGDYTNTVMDPLNDSVFWSLQEYAGNTVNNWATWWARVNPYVQVADFAASENVICPGQSVTFADSSNFTGTTYEWSFPGGVPATSTSANPVVTYAASGRYRVTLTLDGKVQTKDGFIIVAANPIRTILNNAPNPCEGTEVTLTVSQASGVYLWNTGETTRSIKTKTPGIYACMVTAPNGLCSRMSDSVNLVFKPLPVVTLDSILPMEPTGAPLTLTGGLPQGGTYSGPGVNAGVFDPSVAGIGLHKITYSYTDPGTTCNNKAIRYIQVGNSVGVNSVFKVKQFNVTPNPSQGLVSLVFEADRSATLTVQVIDQLGRVVWSQNYANASRFAKEIDLSVLKPGVYYIRANFAEQSELRKLVIE